MAYSDLTETEQHYWDEYATLRAITDWEGFTEAQMNRKQAARDWLVNQRKEIWRCAEGKKPQDCKPGWNINNRSARYATLSDDNLNNATAKHEYTLPANGCVPSEKAYIEEREGYLMIGGDGKSADDEQKARKTANSDWLVERRKKVWHLGEDEGWDEADRQLRYQNLCIATHTGEAWEEYEASHNKYGQAITEESGTSSRGQCVSNCRKHLGVKENPTGSNRGSPQPDKWEHRVYGSSGVPWCACFATCMAWDVGVKGSGSAGVQVLVDMARQGTGMMRGYTTDPSAVLRGDFAIVGCTSCHVGVVIDTDNPCHLIEGNGDDGGSYNGGEVVERHRGRSEIVGWCLVDYP
jgi:hypothetical protein